MVADVLPPPLAVFQELSTRVVRDRYALPVAFLTFAVAGGLNTGTDALVPTVGATGLAIIGVSLVAVFARAVSRPTLALVSLGFWIAVLAIAGAHLVEMVAGGWSLQASPGWSVAVSSLTWAVFLGACSATGFLAFREYGAGPSPDPVEDGVLESEYDF